MKVLYASFVGPSDPTRASFAFHFAANGSAEIGQEAVITLAGDAVELVSPGASDSVTGVGVPPLSQLLEKVREHTVPVFV